MSVAASSSSPVVRRRRPGWWVLGAGIAAIVTSALLDVGSGLTVDDAGFLAQSGAVAAAAGLLLARRPGNKVGLVVALVFLVGAVASATFSYARHQPSLPRASVVALIGTAWVGTLLLGLVLVLLPLLFPSGALPSRRWRPVACVGALGTVLVAAGVALQPGDLEGLPGVANPMPATDDVVFAVTATGGVLLLGATLGALTSLVVRYRRGSARERVQVRWLVTVLALLVVGIVVMNILTGGNRAENVVLDAATGFLIVAGLPLVATVAVLHDDIGALDRLIRRTLVYAVLWLLITSLVLSVPLGLGVAAGERVPFTIAVVVAIAATLAVHPLRRRLLRLADRLAADAAGRAEAADRRSAELAASRSRIAAAARVERQRIQRDLHDGAQQELLALIAKIRFLRERSDLDRAEHERTLSELQRDAASALTGLRELAHGIHPPILTDRGLAPALEDRIDSLPVDVSLRLSDGCCERRYAADIEATAYFVACEALANVIKHAAARSVAVRLDQHGDSLRLEVCDDGVGADDLRTGTGLTGLADRVEAVGGRLSTRSHPGQGTTVTAELPANPPEDGDG